MKKKKIKTTAKKKTIKKVKANNSKNKRPVSEYYNLETNEVYPKLIFRQDSLWTRIKRFFGFIP